MSKLLLSKYTELLVNNKKILENEI